MRNLIISLLVVGAVIGGAAVFADTISLPSYSSASSLDYVEVYKAGTNTKQVATRDALMTDTHIYGRAIGGFGKPVFVAIDGRLYTN